MARLTHQQDQQHQYKYKNKIELRSFLEIVMEFSKLSHWILNKSSIFIKNISTNRVLRVGEKFIYLQVMDSIVYVTRTYGRLLFEGMS